MINSSVLLNLKEKIHGLEEDSFIKDLIETFLRLMPQRIIEIQNALKHQDFEKIAYVAHTAKSSAATMGAENLHELFVRLELFAQSRSPKEMANLAIQLDPVFQQTKQKLITLQAEL